MKDTICAIATKLGMGAISIIRVSGDESIKKVNQCFQGSDLEKVKSHTIHYGYIKDQEKMIDEVLISVMRKPKTYTREDVVEINCHGGIFSTQKVLETLLKNGIRLAEPGEFTKRAFLNGRIDLSQAESVMELIESKNETAREIAFSSLSGSISHFIHEFREELKKLIASIEVNIDYPEYEDIEKITEEKLEEKVKQFLIQLEKIVKNSKEKQIFKNGIKTGIIGRPNVGKSSILNHLLEEEKAIVTSIAGTTRDVVEGEINLDGISLQISDTAGIRETEDLVEKLGVEKSKKMIQESDLVLFIIDGSNSLEKEDRLLFPLFQKEKTIVVINKEDKGIQIKKEQIPFSHVVYTTTKEQEGLDSLKEEIKKMFFKEEILEREEIILFNTRQIALAEKAYHLLKEVLKQLKQGIELDLISLDLKEVLDQLGEITGESYPEEILDTLFENFCVGK